MSACVGEIGTFTGATLAISAVGALIVTPLMKRCATDWHIAISAALAAVITNVFKFFVRNSLMMYFCKCLIEPRYYCILVSRRPNRPHYESCLSACPSVPCGILTRKLKWCDFFFGTGVTGVLFSIQKVKG